MSTPPTSQVQTPPPPDRLKAFRDWLDVLAKVAIAGVGVVFAYLADDYKQKTSIVTLLSQREAAESELRSSMLQNLIGPFVGGAEGKQLPPERARVLLDLLALNFHSHFELKPLWLKVDAELTAKDDRNALREVARRVVSRQIDMLMAASGEIRGGWLERLFAKRPAGASQFDLFFSPAPGGLADPGRVLLAQPGGSYQDVGGTDGEKTNAATNPAYFVNGSGQGVCAASPNGAYALQVMVVQYDSKAGTATVAWRLSSDRDACVKAAAGDDAEVSWVGDKFFTVTPYDLPLTDNTPLDPRQRFAINLFYVDDSSEPPTLQIKLVWFPEGYITERERPMNYYEVNKTLGLQ